jgi:hypothetical protein
MNGAEVGMDETEPRTTDGIPKLPDPANGIIPPGRYWFDSTYGPTIIDILDQSAAAARRASSDSFAASVSRYAPNAAGDVSAPRG